MVSKDIIHLYFIYNKRWMSEKFDGIRAYWNGNDFYTKKGHLIVCPKEFKMKIPKNYELDGELW